MEDLKANDQMLLQKPLNAANHKLKAIPIVNSFLENYERLLELMTDHNRGANNIESIMQYILTIDDVVKDSVGVLGLVDDLFAMEQLDLKISTDDPAKLNGYLKLIFRIFNSQSSWTGRVIT